MTQFRPPTGDLSDPVTVAHLRDQWLRQTTSSQPTLAVVDLSGKLFSPPSLHELIVPLGQRIRGGEYGHLRLVVVTPDASTQEILRLLARRYDIPLFIASTSAPEDVEYAEPAGNLTASDAETLAYLATSRRSLTAAGYASAVGIEPTAANNRLVNLERKGYVYRVRRPRRYGDLFVDPRYPIGGIKDGYEPSPMTEVLADHGVTADPYETSDVTLESDAANRAADVLRRRHRID